MKLVLAALALALITPAAEGQAGQVEKVVIGGRPGAMLSPIVKVGNIIYLSGQLGTVPRDSAGGGGGMAPGGVGPETTAAMENIKRLLTQAGSSMDRIIKCTVLLADISDFQAMNASYRPYFPTNAPARSTVAVAGLVNNARVEIECMALAGS
jgi:reactive intermediate/imine deaminase